MHSLIHQSINHDLKPNFILAIAFHEVMKIFRLHELDSTTDDIARLYSCITANGLLLAESVNAPSNITSNLKPELNAFTVNLIVKILYCMYVPRVT